MPRVTTANEPPTLRALLRRRTLRLRLEGEETSLEVDALDKPVRWVHSSDLLDPTPFLSDGLALLTTGTQFPADGHVDYDSYIARLRGRGVLGLGFGTEVAREGIPVGLIDACRNQRMPLFEVPYLTPFIAVARANAEAVAAAAYARRTWALEAQRAVSLAALRVDGLNATLAELSRRLGAWVGLFDSLGVLIHVHPAPLSPDVADVLASDVRVVLSRAMVAGSTLRVGTSPFVLHTLGRGGHLHGVLAVGADELDQEARAVVTAVVALAELSFAQEERLAEAIERLRGALLHFLLEDDPALTARISRELWGPVGGALPTAPIEIAVTRDASGHVLDHIDRLARGGGVFFAHEDETVTIVTSVGTTVPVDLATRFDLRLGVSSPTGYDSFARAHAQALEALRRGKAPVTRFGDLRVDGVLGSIQSDAARLHADAMLGALRAHDTAEGTQLEQTLRVWLEQDARFDAAADALDVHRHTVRARIAHAARLLELDLDTFPARAEVWAALRFSPR